MALENINWLDMFGDLEEDIQVGHKLSGEAENTQYARNGSAYTDADDIDRQPIYSRIFEIIKKSIQSSQLPAGTKLPTNRELAAMLKIDRSTVSRAYLELEKAGFIHKHVGRGTFVRDHKNSLSDLVLKDTGPESLKHVGHQKKAGKGKAGSVTRFGNDSGDSSIEYLQDHGSAFWIGKFSQASNLAESILVRQQLSMPRTADLISFSSGSPSEDCFPHEAFQDVLAEVVKSRSSQDLLGYCPAEGNRDLRDEVKKHLATKDIYPEDDELLILSGSQQGLDLIARTLINPQDAIIVEDPTYPLSLISFAASQANFIPVENTEHGMNLAQIEQSLSRGNVKFIYMMPTFQNPTGSVMPLEDRLELLRIARRHQVMIYEDHYASDLEIDGKVPPPLIALTKDKNLVVHQGTFSKALCPGLRLGWLVGPAALIQRIKHAKKAVDLSTNSIAQSVMHEFLRQGLYKSHLETMQDVYRQRRDTICRALKQHLGHSARFHVPQGGLFVWVQLSEYCLASKLLVEAEKLGVSFMPGDIFSIGQKQANYMRLSFVQNDLSIIEEGIQRLGKALTAYLKTRPDQYDSSDSYEPMLI